MLKINAEKRDVNEDLSEIRKNGAIPAVFYGPKEESTSIKIKLADFLKIYREAGESSVIVLNDGKEDHQALIHEVQIDPISDKPLHVDFYIIEKGKKVNIHVPLVFIGESPAEKNLGGILVKVMHELEIEAMPIDLPHEIQVDISSLVDFESQIHAKDVKIPANVTLLSDPDEVVVLVQEAKEEIIEEAPVEADLASIQVEKKGKEETEETPVKQ
jgi:large subunit ribosomal protein L25